MGLGLKGREEHTDMRHKAEGHTGSAARGLQVGRRDPGSAAQWLDSDRLGFETQLSLDQQCWVSG